MIIDCFFVKIFDLLKGLINPKQMTSFTKNNLGNKDNYKKHRNSKGKVFTRLKTNIAFRYILMKQPFKNLKVNLIIS